MARLNPSERVNKSHTGAYWLWAFAVAANGFLAFLWCVFGAAAAGNANNAARNFLLFSTFAAVLPIAVSIFFLSRKRFGYAFWSPFATLPMLVLSLLALGG